jgi:hypothetical protein
VHQLFITHLVTRPITSTCLINIIYPSYLFTNINHQDNSQPYGSQYHQDVHQPRLLTNINNIYQNQDVPLNVYQVIYTTSSINHVPTILLASASNNVPNMYQSCINYRSNYDSSRCTNITILYTSHMCYSSTICPNMYHNHIPNTYTNIPIKSSLEIHHTIHNQIP